MTGHGARMNDEGVHPRRQWRLPVYPAHDALSDALATAEPFLVLRVALGARTVRDLR